jgi:hypothetical protein
MTIAETFQPAYNALFAEPLPRTFEVQSGIRILLNAEFHALSPQVQLDCGSVREYLGTEIAFPCRHTRNEPHVDLAT